MGRKPNIRPASGPQGPSQRQLRAGELIRHALVDVLREEDIHDDALRGISVTVTEVRMSPDLKHATCFVEPLGAGVAMAGRGLETGADAKAPATTAPVRQVIDALNAHAKFLRGLLGRRIAMKFTPELRFRRDESFDAASHMDRLFDDPRVRRDLEAPSQGEGDG